MGQPGKPFQSKLRPYTVEIHRLRREGASYLEIANYLQAKHGLEISADAVGQFYRRLLKRKTEPAGFTSPLESVAAAAPEDVVSEKSSPRRKRAKAKPPVAKSKEKAVWNPDEYQKRKAAVAGGDDKNSPFDALDSFDQAGGLTYIDRS